MFESIEYTLVRDSFLKKLHCCDNKRDCRTTFWLFLVTILFTTHAFELQAQAVEIDIKYTTGKFEPSQNSDFVLIEKKYVNIVDPSKKMYLRRETYTQLKKMFEAAAKDGIKFNVLSATRNFNYQKNIWMNKWRVYKNEPTDVARSKKILEFSAMPGASRHHWGTDVDLVAVTNTYFERGEGLKIYNWLLQNAARFGFCQPYTKNRKTGYNEEKWHWSYLPLAQQFQKFTVSHLTDTDFKDFLGANTAIELQIVKNYIAGINVECQPN